MLDLLYNFSEFEISSIYEDDVSYLKKWLNNITKTNKKFNDIKIEDVDERYLEYLVSEGEIFLKICKNNKIIGLVKGRIEFGEVNKVWFSTVIFDIKQISEKEKLNLINKVLSGLSNEYCIGEFVISIASDDKDNLNFWSQMGFQLSRISKNYYEINGRMLDMMLLKKYI